MSDIKQRPDAAETHNPAKQVGEDVGAIKGPQRTDAQMDNDMPRGSEPSHSRQG